MSDPFGPDLATTRTPAQRPERRRYARHLCNPRPVLNLLVRPSFFCGRALVHDASPGGVGLLVPQPLKVGSVLALQLREAPHGTSCTLLVRVVHATPFPAGGWLIGCRLEQPLSENDC
jgi:hypothetical protein